MVIVCFKGGGSFFIKKNNKTKVIVISIQFKKLDENQIKENLFDYHVLS